LSFHSLILGVYVIKVLQKRVVHTNFYIYICISHNLKINRFLHESLLQIWDFVHECEKFRLFTEWSVAERVERRWISLTSGRNLRSSIRTSASTCFFRFNLKTKHVDFIHSFACQCHVYYTKYYNATCNAINTHLFNTALSLLGEIS
jgi:hypothetical protein